jgi:glyoxylate/hydroxypyruvate reductase A
MTETLSQRPPCIALLSQVASLDSLAEAFRSVRPDVDLRMGEDLGPLEDIDVAVCWHAPRGLLARLPRLQLMQSLAAGIDHMVADPDLPLKLPLCRIIDQTMAAGMKAYVSWAVVQQHRRMKHYVDDSQAGVWREQPVFSPRGYRVGIAGLGRLGMACAEALATIGYQVRGWAKTEKTSLPAGVEGFHGADQLDSFLSGCDALVCLLPLTDATRGFLNAGLFAKLPKGAHVINVGRGAHLVEADLLSSLESGQLSGATLDTFEVEPLPKEHPFWRNPSILVTPHIATRTDRMVIAEQTLSNLESIRAGRRPVNQVDLSRGY